jgi:hypothetical protein
MMHVHVCSTVDVDFCSAATLTQSREYAYQPRLDDRFAIEKFAVSVTLSILQEIVFFEGRRQ